MATESRNRFATYQTSIATIALSFITLAAACGQQTSSSSPLTSNQSSNEKTVTAPIADLTLTVPSELEEKKPFIEPNKNGDVTWTVYGYEWRKDTLEVSVDVTNWDKDFPPQAGGIPPEALLERDYAIDERQKTSGEEPIEELRYLEIDGVKGEFFRAAADPEDKNKVWLVWHTFRYHKTKAQSLRISVRGMRGDLEKLMKIINSARLAQR